MTSGSPAVSLRRRGSDSEPATALQGALAAERQTLGLLGELRAVQAAMIDAVVSGAGLGRVAKQAADASRGTVAIIVPRSGGVIAPEHARASTDLSVLVDWVSGRTRGRPAAVPPGVLAEVPVRFRDEVVGIVALLSNEQAPRPEAAEFLHLAAVAALIQVAVEDAKEETEQHLRGSFLEELRSRNELGGPEIVRRAARLGCDLSAGGLMLCATLTSDRPRLVATTIAAEYPGALAEQLDGAAPDARPRIYAALPAGVGDGSPAAAMGLAQQLVGRLQRHAIVGLSSFHANPAELGGAAHEAELVLEVLQQSGAPIAEEIGGGTYKLLFRMLASHPEEVRSFYEETVAVLVRYDDKYRTELLRTLEAYLDANCNMNATATEIFTHRHTVAYRLERIHELTGLDPMLSEHRERLGLGLKVHRIFAPQFCSSRWSGAG